jgi:hypothetical protein
MKKPGRGALPGASQVELVTLAVYVLGGDTRPVDTEDVAKKVDGLAPGRFTWRKYKDQINLELIRVFLSDAKKPANGGFVAGSGRSGWTLTSAGREWAENRGRKLLGTDLTRAREESRAQSLDENRWRRERARIQTSSAWALWTRREQIGLREAAEVFRIDTYAQGRTRDLKIARVREMFTGDGELAPFLDALASILEKGAL